MKIKDWNKFQHFKDRRPPWVKLYRDILEDPDWHQLDTESSKVLVMLWLVASEDESQQGVLPDIRKLAFRLRMTEKTLSLCISKLSHWLDQDDVAKISDCYQDDAPEGERETERETEREKKIASRRNDISLESLSVDHISKWLSEKRAKGIYLNHDPDFVLERFKDYCRSKGKTYKDYAAAYRQAFEWDSCQPKHHVLRERPDARVVWG